MSELEQAAATLRAAVHDLLGRLGGASASGEVTRDESLDCDASSVRWEYNLRARSTVDDGDSLVALASAYQADGWRVVDRSGPRERALQLSRGGVNLGVHLGGGTLVIGGSTPCLPH